MLKTEEEKRGISSSKLQITPHVLLEVGYNGGAPESNKSTSFAYMDIQWKTISNIS